MSKTFTVHPSRTAPLCSACHWQRQTDSRFERCDHPATPVDPVDGGLPTCASMRDSEAYCGPGGSLFTAQAEPA